MTHETLPCEVPTSFDPLFTLLHSLTELALLAGVVLATLGLMVVALLYLWPGPDSTKRAKRYGKTVIVGTVILLSAHMVVDFLIAQLGAGVVC